VEATAGIFSEALGGDDDFQRARLIAMQYFPFGSRLFLGLRGDVFASFGDAPFYLRPFVYMRGVPIMRYQGEEIAQLEAELRWQFWKRFSVVGSPVSAPPGMIWNISMTLRAWWRAAPGSAMNWPASMGSTWEWTLRLARTKRPFISRSAARGHAPDSTEAFHYEHRFLKAEHSVG
jgi:hypothetical protein